MLRFRSYVLRSETCAILRSLIDDIRDWRKPRADLF